MAPLRKQLQELSYSPVSRVTVQEHVYGRLRELILNGGIEPGRTVTVVSLSEAFGVSAMPVREALQRLTGERALTVISGRSVGIPALDAGRLRDLTRVRVEIESIAAEWATPKVSEGDRRKLQDLVDVMAKAAQDGDTRAYVRGNHAFHFTVYAASGSEALLTTIEGLWMQVSPYFHLLHSSGNYVAANEEHRMILQAIRAGDARACAAHLRDDITSATDVLLKMLG